MRVNLNTLWRKLTARFARPVERGATVIHEPPQQPGGIGDGLDYAMPVIVPGYVRRQLNEAQLRTYIEAASREPFRHQFGSPYSTDLPYNPVTEDPLREPDYSTRVAIHTTCHAAYHRNPLINAAVQYSADFTIGDGFNLNCKNTDVSDILYQFIDHEMNAIREYERQACIDLQVDGELFLRIFEGSAETDQLIRVIPMRPWECQYIRTEKGDFRSRVSYHFMLNETEGDDPIVGTGSEEIDIPASDMLHVAINRHAYELRGRPELYRILAWARADTEFLENRARQNFWRGALLWHVRIKNAIASTIASVSSKWAKPPAPGSSVVTSDMQEILPLTNSTSGGDASEDGRAIKNRVIIGFRMAEYMFAEGANTNLATATAQQLPALTRFSAFQRILVEQLWYPLLKRVLQKAIDEGLLPEEVEEQDSEGEPIREEPKPEDAADAIAQSTEKRKADEQAELDAEYGEAAPVNGAKPEQPEQPPKATGMPDPMMPDLTVATPVEGKVKMIKTLDAFEVTYEPVSATDPQALTQALIQQAQMEWIDDDTAMIELGRDPYYVRKMLKRQTIRQRKEMAQGLKPVPPEMMGKPAPNGQQPPEEEKVA